MRPSPRKGRCAPAHARPGALYLKILDTKLMEAVSVLMIVAQCPGGYRTEVLARPRASAAFAILAGAHRVTFACSPEVPACPRGIPRRSPGYQRFQAAPRGRSRRRHGRHRRAPADAQPGWPQRRSAGAKALVRLGRRLEPLGGHRGRGGFDKGTLAAALIGLLRAGQKPARSANQRTGRRPLSNPPLPHYGS
jgi:hypothetical protein